MLERVLGYLPIPTILAIIVGVNRLGWLLPQGHVCFPPAVVPGAGQHHGS